MKTKKKRMKIIPNKYTEKNHRNNHLIIIMKTPT